MKKLSFFSLFILFSTLLSAQTEMVGMNINAYQPLSTFGQNVTTIPVGFSMSYLHQAESSRFSYGFEGGLSIYSCEESTIVYKGAEVAVMEEDLFFTLKAVVRYELYSTEGANLYAEGKAGSMTFFSSTSPVDCSSGFEGSTDFHGTSFNASLGGGLMFNPTIFSDYDANNNIWIDLGVSSTGGTSSSYAVQDAEQSIRRSMAQSFTHYIDYRIGVIIKL